MSLWQDILNRAFRSKRVERGNVPSVQRTLAGPNITSKNAIQLPAVLGCVTYIQQAVGPLPWHVYRKVEGGNEIVQSHRVEYMLSTRPSPEWSSFAFRETLLNWALLWGNGIAEIERDLGGQPFALHPIPPWRVEVCRRPDTGKLYYEVDGESGGAKIELEPEDVFHIRGFGHGPVGIDIVGAVAQSLGWSRAAELFGAAFFGNGANVAGVVANKKPLTEAAFRLQKAEFGQLYGGVKNAHKTAFIDNEATWTRIGMNAAETQLVDVHRFLVEQVCRIFQVPPHIVAELSRSTNNNIEHQGIEAVQRCLLPWVRRFEDEANYKLFGAQNRQKLFTKINMRGLLRGDNASRVAFYKEMFAMGAYSPNRILELEDENTLGPVGDKHLVQLNLTTLDKAGEDIPEPPAPTPSTPPAEKAAQNRLLALADMETETV